MTETSDRPETVFACPCCDAAEIYRRETASENRRWRCNACKEEFPEPTEREARYFVPLRRRLEDFYD